MVPVDLVCVRDGTSSGDDLPVYSLVSLDTGRDHLYTRSVTSVCSPAVGETNPSRFLSWDTTRNSTPPSRALSLTIRVSAGHIVQHTSGTVGETVHCLRGHSATGRLSSSEVLRCPFWEGSSLWVTEILRRKRRTGTGGRTGGKDGVGGDEFAPDRFGTRTPGVTTSLGGL